MAAAAEVRCAVEFRRPADTPQRGALELGSIRNSRALTSAASAMPPAAQVRACDLNRAAAAQWAQAAPSVSSRAEAKVYPRRAIARRN